MKYKTLLVKLSKMTVAYDRGSHRLLDGGPSKYGRCKLQAHGLSSNTTFAVFLTKKSALPVGACGRYWHLHDGCEGLRGGELRAIVEEAFSSTLVKDNKIERAWKELDYMIFWFVDPDTNVGQGGW